VESSEQPSYDHLLQENVFLNERVLKYEQENQKLWQQLRELKRHIFGRRSEKLSVLSSNQTSLFPLEDIETEGPEPEVAVPAHKRHRRGRKPLPADLPRERIEYEPEEQQCACCGGDLAKIGEEVTEELDYIPARFLIREHVKIKRACSKCKDGVFTAKLPAEVQLIEKGRPGIGLLVHIMISKYCDHQPLNRQEQIFSRHGVHLARQRMCDWIGTISEQYLTLIALALKKEILKSSYIRADETTLKVQTKAKQGSLHQGYLWGMLSLEGDVYFEYDKSRAGKVAERLFKGCKSLIQTDLYAGDNKVYLPEGASRAGCWDHVRRRFIKAQESEGKVTADILKRIASLYKLEKEFKRKHKKEESFPYDLRKEFRQKKSKPIILKLKEFLKDVSIRTLPKSDLAEAVAYALKQWDALTIFLDNPLVELGNIAIEQQIRPIAVGRHNWNFAGSERGAKWAATLYSIIATCKRNKINPYDYLTDVLKRLPGMKNSEIHSIMPRAWADAQE